MLVEECSMSDAPTSPGRWPMLLLLGVAVFGPPSIAVLKFTQAITQNPWLTASLILLYEAIVVLISIVSGVWQQLKNSWVERIAAAIDSAVQNALSRYYHHYRAYFCYEHRDLDLRGMSIQGEYTLDLEDVFVELRIDPKPIHEASPDPLRLPAKSCAPRVTPSGTICEQNPYMTNTLPSLVPQVAAKQRCFGILGYCCCTTDTCIAPRGSHESFQCFCSYAITTQQSKTILITP
jgi:hypothetical protein